MASRKKSAAELADAALELQVRLGSLGVRELVVPSHPTEKRPIVSHRGGAWTEAMAVAWFRRPPARDFQVGVLLRDLVVLDFDDMRQYERARARFPADLDAAPTERTSRGVHAFFRRCDRLDSAGVTDRVKVLRGPAGEQLDIDVKTVTDSLVGGVLTSGFLVVAPSAGRTWERSLLEVEPQPMSRALATWVASCYEEDRRQRGAPRKRKLGSRDAAPARKLREEECWNVQREDGTLRLRNDVDVDRADAEALMGGACTGTTTAWTRGGVYQGCSFRFDGPCPICGKAKHKNQFYVIWTALGGRVLKNHSTDCKPQGIPLPYKHLPTYQAAFDQLLASRSTARLDADAVLQVLSGLPPQELCATGESAWRVDDTFYCAVLVGGARQYAVVLPDTTDIGGSSGANVRLMKRPWDVQRRDWWQVYLQPGRYARLTSIRNNS